MGEDVNNRASRFNVRLKTIMLRMQYSNLADDKVAVAF